MSDQIQKGKSQIANYTKSLEDSTNDNSLLHKIISKQSAIANSKIEAIEAKCQNLRRINLGLEVIKRKLLK